VTPLKLVSKNPLGVEQLDRTQCMNARISLKFDVLCADQAKLSQLSKSPERQWKPNSSAGSDPKSQKKTTLGTEND
jgi:hypothetical protein